MTDCIFCKIVAGEVPSTRVYEDAEVIAFKDIHPKAPVHVLVVPRQHIDSLNELTPAHDALVAQMLRLLPRIAKELGLDRGYRAIVNTGPGGGQEVPHLHIHLLGGGRLPGF